MAWSGCAAFALCMHACTRSACTHGMKRMRSIHPVHACLCTLGMHAWHEAGRQHSSCASMHRMHAQRAMHAWHA
eukprot:363985-Chlamydomonas_euryale.AAC.4